MTELKKAFSSLEEVRCYLNYLSKRLEYAEAVLKFYTTQYVDGTFIGDEEMCQ